MSHWRATCEPHEREARPARQRPARAARSFYTTRRPRGRRPLKGWPACERRAVPAEEGPSLARRRTVPCSMMSRWRDESQRAAAEGTRALRLALQQQQELGPETLEQQLRDNEECGTIGCPLDEVLRLDSGLAQANFGRFPGGRVPVVYAYAPQCGQTRPGERARKPSSF